MRIVPQDEYMREIITVINDQRLYDLLNDRFMNSDIEYATSEELQNEGISAVFHGNVLQPMKDNTFRNLLDLSISQPASIIMFLNMNAFILITSQAGELYIALSNTVLTRRMLDHHAFMKEDGRGDLIALLKQSSDKAKGHPGFDSPSDSSVPTQENENADNHVYQLIGDKLACHFQEIELDSCREKVAITSGFIDMFSHDIGLPLTSLKSNIEHLLIGAEGTLSEEQKYLLTSIQDSVERINDMRKEALMLNKLDSGNFTLNKSLTSIHSLLQDIMFRLQPLSNKKNQTLELKSPHFSAEIDNNKIRHVIENLVTNAIKYTPSNGTIIITAEKDEDVFRIRVIDNGAGIPQESVDHIFKRFTRFHKNIANGTGLGLAIAKSMVTMHDGRIWHEPRTGGGSIFIVELPRK